MSVAPGARLLVVVGSGGVGKTTVAAALGVDAARHGARTLVMTFDPSQRLKQSLGVGDRALDAEVEVPLSGLAGLEATGQGSLAASLLDARRTFDRLVTRYSPDAAARERILTNPFYDRLSGGLAGILEYMAVERLFEVAASERFDRIVLDTPPTRQALDFLGAPDRIVSFLDSGVLKLALRPWFDEQGRFRPTARWGALGRGVESYLDQIVGLEFLRQMGEFFQAFAPLYAGFRSRAEEVKRLLAAPSTLFLLVAGPQEECIPDTVFFARKLAERGLRTGPLIINRIHPRQQAVGHLGTWQHGADLLHWLGERDCRGAAELRSRLSADESAIELPLISEEPTHLAALAALGSEIGRCWPGS